MLVVENTDRYIKFAMEFLIQPIHKKFGEIFVGNIFGEQVLQSMRKRSVSDVVHQNGDAGTFGFFIGNVVSFRFERFNGSGH